MVRIEFTWAAGTDFGSHLDQKLSRPPSSAVLDAHLTVSAAAPTALLYLGISTRVTRASLFNLSTQLRPTETRNIGLFLLPAPRAGHTRTHNSEQIPAVTIEHHIEYRKTRYLQRSLPLSTANTFRLGGLAISCLAQTSFYVTAVRGDTDLDNSR